MAKRLHRLSARTVATATKPGRHADGGNLYLAVTKAGAKRWTFLYEHQGKQREAGLGSVNAVSLAEARAKAAEYRSMLARGVVTRSRQRVRPRRFLCRLLASLPTSFLPPSAPVGAARRTLNNGKAALRDIPKESATCRSIRSASLKCCASCSRFGSQFQKPRRAFVAGLRLCSILPRRGACAQVKTRRHGRVTSRTFCRGGRGWHRHISRQCPTQNCRPLWQPYARKMAWRRVRLNS
jgi:hypothetical protein